MHLQDARMPGPGVRTRRHLSLLQTEAMPRGLARTAKELIHGVLYGRDISADDAFGGRHADREAGA